MRRLKGLPNPREEDHRDTCAREEISRVRSLIKEWIAPSNNDTIPQTAPASGLKLSSLHARAKCLLNDAYGMSIFIAMKVYPSYITPIYVPPLDHALCVVSRYTLSGQSLRYLRK